MPGAIPKKEEELDLARLFETLRCLNEKDTSQVLICSLCRKVYRYAPGKSKKAEGYDLCPKCIDVPKECLDGGDASQIIRETSL